MKAERANVTVRLPPWLHQHLAVIAAASRTSLNALIVRELKMRIDGLNQTEVTPVVHFVGFKDDRYWNAVRIWGRPHFVHPAWDERARREIHPSDTIVFAEGDETQKVARFNATDYNEQEPK